MALVLAGAPLRDIGAVLGVPPWLRNWPPAALGPLPIRMDASGDDRAFGSRISGIVAGHPPNDPAWLQLVLMARRRGGDDFAVWIARQTRGQVMISPMAVSLLAAFSYYSSHPESFASQFVIKRFHARMSAQGAATAASEWMLGLLLDLKALSGPPGCIAPTIDGLRIVPLQTLADLRSEGEALRNCLGGYGLSVLSDHTRIFSVRNARGSLAAFEVDPGVRGSCFPDLIDIEGPGNARAPCGVGISVVGWLRHADSCHCLWRDHGPAIDASLWREVWRPYASAHATSRRFRADPPVDLAAELLTPLFCLAQAQ